MAANEQPGLAMTLAASGKAKQFSMLDARYAFGNTEYAVRSTYLF